MKTYVCVFRQPTISFKDREGLLLAAKRHPLIDLKQLMDKQIAFMIRDDDPGFFAATELLGHPKYASWGVCREDVRRQRQPRDLVIFFSAATKAIVDSSWQKTILRNVNVHELSKHAMQMRNDHICIQLINE